MALNIGMYTDRELVAELRKMGSRLNSAGVFSNIPEQIAPRLECIVNDRDAARAKLQEIRARLQTVIDGANQIAKNSEGLTYEMAKVLAAIASEIKEDTK